MRHMTERYVEEGNGRQHISSRFINIEDNDLKKQVEIR